MRPVDVYLNVMRVYIIVIFLACSFVAVLIEVVTPMRKSSCAAPLGSSGRRKLAHVDLVGVVEIV